MPQMACLLPRLANEMNKWIFAGLLLFWLAYLCVPSLRGNLKTELISPGLPFQDDQAGCLRYKSPHFKHQWQWAALETDPRWRRVDDSVSDDANVVVQEYAHDPAVLAWWLKFEVNALEPLRLPGYGANVWEVGLLSPGEDQPGAGGPPG